MGRFGNILCKYIILNRSMIFQFWFYIICLWKRSMIFQIWCYIMILKRSMIFQIWFYIILKRSMIFQNKRVNNFPRSIIIMVFPRDFIGISKYILSFNFPMWWVTENFRRNLDLSISITALLLLLLSGSMVS